VSRILIMSSWTSVGHVGLSAATPVLQALGHEVTQLPTIILSNHPGWPRFAGQPVAPEELAGMIDAIDANGWLDGHEAFLTGYLPSAAHVALACDLVGRLRRLESAPTVVLDPILGDEPKGLYVPEDAAIAVRDKLACILTPDRFELGWLTGRSAP
jgi:pyridoxine kinase